MPASVAAQTWHTLIDEEFIVPEGTSLVGHVPETNLPGGTWSLGGAPGLVVHNQAVHPTGFGPLEAYATIDARVRTPKWDSICLAALTPLPTRSPAA